MVRILFQGDSITDGNRYKSPEQRGDLNHQIGHSYVFNITGILGRKYPGRFTFINRGVSGDSVERISARWQRDTLDEHPDVLSLLLGINGNGAFDGCYAEGTEEHLRRFEKQYRELLESAREQNPQLKLIIVEPFALPVAQVKLHYDAFMNVFSCKQRMIQRVAQDYEAIFVPVQKKMEKLVEKTAPVLLSNNCVTDPCAYWLWDGIHPTEPMHSFLAELWLDATRELWN